MTTGSWDPESGTSTAGAELDAQLLGRLLTIAESGSLDALEALMTPDDVKRSAIMQLPLTSWETALENYNNAQLLALIRFFTLAEMQLPGWQAGEKSPVIAINRLLKGRGHKLEKPLLQWIRQNSDNRFLPNGPIG
ncbi:MAG: hypothetical protein HKO07_09320 [Pseudomonadales bacterium]|nr:hypothetical protein [Pseudomonadales bacterium]